MSRILRRPLFRGGPVSSYGTGIASGLADGGRVGLKKSFKGTVGQAQANMKNKKFMTGGDIVENVNRYSYFDPNALPGFSSVKRALPIVDKYADEDGGQQLGDTDYLVEKGYISDVEKPVDKMSMAELIDYQIGEKGDVYQTGKSGLTKTVTGIDEQGNLITTTEDGKPRQVTSVEDLTEDEKITYRNKQKDSATGAASMESTLPGVIKVETTPTIVDTKTAQVLNEGEESTTINEAEIRERAELFNKLLSEGFEKEKKSAQISDASDYALKFFESTVGQGKGMKEAAGDVAGFALAKPSKTETVKAGQKKTKQTATVMAINDYLAGEKSERELKKILATADYKGNINLKNSLALIEKKRKDVGTRISEAAAKSGIGGVATISTIENVLRPEGKKITKIPADQTGKWTPDKEDEGSYIIEEETKSVFEIINGVPVKIY